MGLLGRVVTKPLRQQIQRLLHTAAELTNLLFLRSGLLGAPGPVLNRQAICEIGQVFHCRKLLVCLGQTSLALGKVNGVLIGDHAQPE